MIRLISVVQVCVILIAGPIAAQQHRPHEFTEEMIQKDLTFLYNKLIEYNPSIGVFHSADEFRHTYDSLQISATGAMTDLQFYPYVAALLAAMHEGHTIPIDNSDTVTNVARGFFNGEFRYFPMGIIPLEGHYFISGNFSASDIPAQGDRLISINGKPIHVIVETISKYVQADGDIELARKNISCENFGAHYYLFIEKPDQYELEFIRADNGQNGRVSIRALPRDSMIYWRNERYGVRNQHEASIDDVYTFELLEDYALLDLNSFSRSDMERYDIKPHKLYEDIFQRLYESGISNLIIDVRDNNGGRREYADELLPYLLKEDLNGIASMSTSWSGRVSEVKLPRRAKYAFDGNVYVLINNRTFSNGSVVASFAVEYADAIAIGSETRSRYEGFAAGSSQKIVLPNTRIPVFTPRYLMTYHDPPGNARNRGVLPVYEVNYSFSEWLEEEDKELDRAIELIRNKN